jgi:DNA repair protein RecO (recombination protein O)
MLHHTRGLIFHSIPYSDSRQIVKIYTELFGLRSYIVTVSRSKTGKIKASLLQPLTHVDLVVQQREKNTLHTIREISCVMPYQQLHTDIVKTSITLFLAEVLNKAVREEEQNPALYAYLVYALQFLDLMQDGLANFHLSFLTQLTRFLGFYPQPNSDGARSVFDLRDGIFRPSAPVHPLYIDIHESRVLERLRDLSFDQLAQLPLNAGDRRLLLSHLLRYYELHLNAMHDIKSHRILETVLG